MNSIRYMITRSCLQEGCMRLARYNESYFPQNGPVQLVDDRGGEHSVQVDRTQMRVWGLGGLYHDHNLGVNDVLMITEIAPTRYQVEAIVKPHAIHPAPRPSPKEPEARRVVVASTPHVREVRTVTHSEPPKTVEAAKSAEAIREVATLFADTPKQVQAEQAQSAPTRETPIAKEIPAKEAPKVTLASAQPQLVQPAPARPEAAAPPAPRPAAAHHIPATLEDQMREFARLAGYRLEFPGNNLIRLLADLGPQHGYSVLLATDPLAMTHPAWEEGQDEQRALLTHESERTQGVPRVTQEAVAALTDHARLAPLSPLDLRGYWRAGNLDLESAASISELISAHLAQRGAFSFVLVTLSQQPAPSVVSAARLAERLGSGVNTAELNTILDTLTRPPFLALTPLPGGQYLLRSDVGEVLADLADYAQGVRRRVGAPAPKAAVNA